MKILENMPSINFLEDALSIPGRGLPLLLKGSIRYIMPKYLDAMPIP